MNSKILFFCNRPKIKLCLGPIQIFLGYIDLLKDSILLSKLVTALGGFYIISINPTKFSSVVSFYECIQCARGEMTNLVFIEMLSL